tara:strand:- start:1663 stop:2139 length:477 start_codon:yes stop_codon:yes gene_type:complete
MSKKIKNLFYPLIVLISTLTILSALYIEHILSVPTCKLCLYQRIPYLFSIIICFFGYFFLNNKIWIYLLIITFVSSIAISGYHLGIENNVFKEFSGCTNESINAIDKSELLQSLNKFSPNCKDVNFRLFGFSLATINFLLSIVLTAITVRYFYYEKNK